MDILCYKTMQTREDCLESCCLLSLVDAEGQPSLNYQLLLVKEDQFSLDWISYKSPQALSAFYS